MGVSTRSQPGTVPDSSLSPNKNKTPSASARPRSSKWAHTPTRLILLWLLFSLPLVIWDTLYVLLRPHSMPGGSLHAPIWTPYALYGTIDYIYGEKAWRENNGFTAAQASLNVLETAGYVGYLWVVWNKGEGERYRLPSRWGGVACLVGFALSVMTVSKTLLYGLNEVFSGFENIGHNDPLLLIFLWIIPNGAWLVLPSYMTYTFATDILDGLAKASGDTSSKPARAAAPSKDE